MAKSAERRDALDGDIEAEEALAWLVASPALRKRVRVIGLATLEYPIRSGLALDAFIAMPLTVKMLLETIEAQHGEPDAAG